MPLADSVNLSVASENVSAVAWAWLVRPVRVPVRWRIAARVSAVEWAPPATDVAARSSCRIMACNSTSSSSRIWAADSCPALVGAVSMTGATGVGAASARGAAGARFLNNEKAIERDTGSHRPNDG